MTALHEARTRYVPDHPEVLRIENEHRTRQAVRGLRHALKLGGQD